VPEIIDPSVAELSPGLYNAARISGLNSAQAKFLNQMSKQYKLGAEILKLGESAGRNKFLQLDPKVRDNIRAFFPDQKMFDPEKTLVQDVLSVAGKVATFPLKMLASPFMQALEALENWEKGTKTPYPAARQMQEAAQAQQMGLPVTKRPDFASGIIKDTFDGRNNWKWDKVNMYEQRYGVALTTLARGMAEGRTVGESIELYGNPDDPEIMAAVVFMYDKPKQFNTIKDGLKIDAQISPGRDFVEKYGSIGKVVEGDYWAGVAQRLLGTQPRIVMPDNVKPGSKEAQRLARKEEIRVKKKVSGAVDAFYTVFIDPLTYIGLGLPAVGKALARGVGGIRVGVREAFQQAAFKTKGQRLAEQFRFVSERKGTEEGYAWLFNEPEVKTLWDDQLGPRLKSYSEAQSPTAKASILESIRFDFPEWYNEPVIKTLTDNKAFDAVSAQKFFTHVDDANLMLNGRVNGISFRRNGIPYARKTRTLTSAMHRVAYAVFNPTSEVDITTKEILQKGDEEAVKAMSILTKVADEENKLLNPAINDLFELQQDVGKARRLALKLGIAATRIPGAIRFGENAIETADNIRNTANLVLPKNIANAVTLMLIDQPLDIQLTAVRNMQYAFMKRMNVPEEDIQKILQDTYNGQAGFAPVVDMPIADNIAAQMHPMAVSFANGTPTLAATGAIEPSQLRRGIKQLPFDLIYQLSSKARLDELSKATPAKNFLLLFNGAARGRFLTLWNNNWAAYTLAPRLGIRTNVDEGFFYYLTKPVTDILDLVSSKFQRDLKGVQAVTGSSAAIGPYKGSLYWLANKRGITVDGRPLDPRKVLTPAQQANVIEELRASISKDLGYDVPMSEIQPVFIKEAIISRVEDILKVNGEEWENWKRVLRNNSNFTEGLTASMGARDLIVGKIDRDFFESMFSVDQLTLFIKELGLERSPLYTPKEIKKMNELELGVSMWDNFLVRFGFNQIKLPGNNYLDPVSVFFNHNGLKNDDFFGAMRPSSNFASARTELMEQMGATYNEASAFYDVLDAKRLQAALSNFGETVYFRQQGVSDPEIARIYSERMLNDMRFAFHGSADGFNDDLYQLMQKKHAEVIKAGTRQGMPVATAWSRAANNLTWKEFDEATVGKRPTSGYINTRLVSNGKVTDMDALKEDLGTIDKWFERFPDKVLEMMDRQVTGFFRLPAMRVAVNKAFNDLKPYEQMLSDRHYRALMDANPSMSPELARARADEIADKSVTNIAVNMATDSVLEFVDNPNIRSNFALAIRYVGRFFRATEDFHRRVYRLYASEGPKALMRLRLLHYGLENVGSVYQDENGDDYLTVPTDIVMNTATQKVLNAFNVDYKVGSFNEFAFKFRLINPSFAPDAGQPAFAGPIAGLSITALKGFLRDLPIVSALLPANWEDNIYPYTNEVANYLDTFAMGHIGQNTDIGEAIRMAFPMLFTTAWDTLAPAEVNKNKANAVYQGMNYMEAFGNGLPDNANNKQKRQYIQNIKVAANNVTAAQAIIGLFGSPAYPSLKDSKGLPDFIRETGISTWTSAFWDIYEGIVKSDPEVANPFELAVAMFIGKNPGKSVYTIPKTNKEFKTIIAKTNELKDWATNNKKFLDDYRTSGISYIFAPKAGEYNPDIYSWLEAQGLVEQADFMEYLNKVQIARDKEKYYAINDALVERLATSTDYQERASLIAIADSEQQTLLLSNPELEDSLDDNISGKDLKMMFRDLIGAVDDASAPIPDATRNAMRLAINEVQSFVDYSTNPAYKQLYTFSDDRRRMKEEVIAVLEQLVFDPAVKEATRLIFVPMLNKYSRDVVGASVERAYVGGR
jgi:hypothetical protein